jgi:hypothetical protein
MTASLVVEGAERSERREFDDSHDNGSRREALAFWSQSRWRRSRQARAPRQKKLPGHKANGLGF